jgi:TrpR-related protein YerC/YecD
VTHRTDRTDEWRNANTASLMDSIVELTERDEAARFFRDLCTRRELEEMTARWAVVKSLGEGHSYREVHDLTGVSTATVTRIAQWVRHGTGGYVEALERANLPTEGI